MALNIFTQETSVETNKKNSTVPEMDEGLFSVSFDSPFASPLTASMNHEAYVKVKENLLELAKSIGSDFQFAVLDLDQSALPNLQYSCFILSAAHKSRKDIIAQHLLLVEATGEDIPVIPQIIQTNAGNISYKIHNPASNAINKVLMDEAAALMARAFPNAQVLPTSATVLPREFNLTDTARLRSLMSEVCQTLATEIFRHMPQFRDASLPELCLDDKGNAVRRFVIKKNTGTLNPQPTDKTGIPFRSDSRVSFEKPGNQGNNSRAKINEKQKVLQATVASCIIDPLWIRQPRNSYYPAPIDPKERPLMPRLVVTNVESTIGQTPGLVMLAIYSAYQANAGHAWRDMLRPSVNHGGGADLRDIGYLNIPANIGSAGTEPGPYISDVSSSAASLADYQSAIFLDSLAVAVDYVGGRSGSSKLEFLSNAAKGGVDATRLIHDTMNRLTNGAFEQFFPRTAPIFSDTPQCFYVGTWRDNAGNLRDSRDFDLTAVCAVNQASPRYIHDWINANFNKAFQEEQRMSAMADMLDQYTGGTFRINGRCERITFSGAFIGAMSMAMSAAAPNALTVDNMSGMDMSNMVHFASFANQAAVMGGAVLPTYGMYQNSQAAPYMAPRHYY